MATADSSAQYASDAQFIGGVATNVAVDPIKPQVRARVLFNGTGTPAILSSYNVSSITDHGVGEYTLNMTTALQDANYDAIGSATNTGAGQANFSVNDSVFARTTTACRILVLNISNTAVDVSRVSFLAVR